MKNLEVTTFTVVGRGEFPIDMLRYDSCWPVDSDSCAAIVVSLADMSRPADRTVRLNTVSRMGATVGRWHSFGWTVIESDPRDR